ncbi:STAS domain-containing protein [Thalassobacillus devorans]|uniref:STAS domain-containing protein n=1 Tax=Thalassobacillus devorans TaxID=279813 RepID=UPI00048A6733|nr:STAS domain-containing protein [Thalassobacillus devorans]
MGFTYEEGQEITDFIAANHDKFEENLLNEAVNVRDKIQSIMLKGNIDLLENAHKLTLHVVKQEEEEVVAFAKQEGVIWAKHSLTLSFKLEWVQAIRRTIWNFLYEYERLSETPANREAFYQTEERINDQIDKFLNWFFLSFSEYKDKLLESQRKLVKNLSVPIIPIQSNVCILPLIGEIDEDRYQTIEEKVLIEVGRLHIQTLIIDLSGVAEMEKEISHYLMKMLDGISMMGCKSVITGMSAAIVRNIVHGEIDFGDKAEIKGNLQQALEEYVVKP